MEENVEETYRTSGIAIHPKVKKFLYIIGALLIIGGGEVGAIIDHLIVNRIPKSPVQTGYVKPSQLEIKVEDLTGDGNNETVMEYQGKKYLLIEKDGMPKVQSYNIIPPQPARIIYKDN